MSESPLSGEGRELLRALEQGPLDVHQLAASLATAPVTILERIEPLVASGRVDAVTLEGGRRAWQLAGGGR